MKTIKVTFECTTAVPDDIDVNQLRGIKPHGELRVRHEDGREFEVRPETCYIKEA